MIRRTTSFALVTQRTPGALLVKAVGRLIVGHGAEPGLWRACLGGELAGDIAVDLSEVVALDARGVGILADTIREAMHRGGRVRIVGAHPRVLRVLELVGWAARYTPSRMAWPDAA